jgi:hypothetical protein
MKVLSRERRKYLIIEALRELEVDEDNYIQMVLPKELGITEKTFKNWINLGKGSSTDIPGQKLLYIAKRLGKTVEELCNEVPQVMNVTRELKDSSNIAARFGLSK